MDREKCKVVNSLWGSRLLKRSIALHLCSLNSDKRSPRVDCGFIAIRPVGWCLCIREPVRRLESRTHSHYGCSFALRFTDPCLGPDSSLCRSRECGCAEYGMSYDNNYFVVGDCHVLCPVCDFLSDVHFLNLVDFLNVRLVHCACANNTCQA